MKRLRNPASDPLLSKVNAIVSFFLAVLAGIILFANPALAYADAQHASGSLSDYRLGSGDQVKIQVVRNDELTVDVRLSDAGTISYPFLGEIKLAGLTIGDAQRLITAGLADGYLRDPRVTVTVQEYRKFFVSGQVKAPGAYPFVPGLTVLKAISIAGGMTEYASDKRISVTRDSSSGASKGNVTLDEQVMPGDIVEVGESFF